MDSYPEGLITTKRVVRQIAAIMYAAFSSQQINFCCRSSMSMS